MLDIEYGASTLRREDGRLVTGRGAYADDIPRADALHMAFVRSPHASARIASIDAAEARERPGVVAVLTAADLSAHGVRDFSMPAKVAHVDGGHSAETPRSLLAREVVRFVGEPVAVVLATSAHAAEDAAEAVAVDYRDRPAVVTVADATAPGAALVWEDRPGNVAYHWRRGGVDAIDGALAGSSHVARLETTISRIAAMPMEPRTACAWPDGDRTAIRVSHQSPHQFRKALCALFELGEAAIRVVAGDVGGSFGLKSGLLREEPLCFWAARHLRRPICWTATRSETFLSDEHARDVQVVAELGLDANGVFTALRVRYHINIGAYLSGRSTPPVNNFGGIAGVYRTPVIVGEAIGCFTNTQPTAAYRGAGRPEATYVIERLIDIAAAETGVDPAELRRRNIIPPDAMPYQTPFVYRYDCGEFERNMDKALQTIDYAGFPARRREALGRGRLRGIGIANPIEVAAGPYAKPSTDHASVRAHPDGTVTLLSGAMSVGQGLETALPDLVAQGLGIPADRVRFVQGDTELVADGKGNGGSSALTLCGSAAMLAVEALIETMSDLAADELEVSVGDVEFRDGRFRIVGSDRDIGLAEVAQAYEAGGNSGHLQGTGKFSQTQPTFPNGCHVCEVEIDPETGEVEVVGYVSVEDVGRVFNPMLVAGQIHGGVAQGLGQALMEQIRFAGDGQLLTGSFMDYAMPRATDIPDIVSEYLETPTALNPLGVKGVGEAGTVGALGAAMNAVCNALAPLGVRNLDMPASPSRVFAAIRAAGSRA